MASSLPSDIDRLKIRYKRFYARLIRYEKTCERLGIPEHKRRTPDLPEELWGLPCGAKTKQTGLPCKSTALYASGRCKFHGGLSTGPTSEAGKAISAANGRKGGRPRKYTGASG
ncbi:MAG TPA: HGGxSTG domain-containing protein [Burkholderiales bacterium]|nr:HGGxSTG domain-containing protein [Burkholderiales bacterium]